MRLADGWEILNKWKRGGELRTQVKRDGDLFFGDRDTTSSSFVSSFNIS